MSVKAAVESVGAPFGERNISYTPTGREVMRDPRPEPLLQKLRIRQAASRVRLPATWRAHGLDPSVVIAAQPGT